MQYLSDLPCLLVMRCALIFLTSGAVLSKINMDVWFFTLSEFLVSLVGAIIMGSSKKAVMEMEIEMDMKIC